MKTSIWKILGPGSFKRQILMTYVVGFFFLIVVFITYMIKLQSDYLYHDSKDGTISLAQSLAASSRSWVLANDVAGLQEVILSFRSHPEMRYAMVISPAGRVLAHTDASKVGQFVADGQSLSILRKPPQTLVMIDDNSIIDVATPIMMDDRHIGWARIAQGRESIADNLTIIIWRSTFFVLLFTALSLFAALLVANRLGYRIKSLVQVAEEVQTGNFNVRARIPGSADEITKLADSLNQMLSTLEQNEKELRSVSRYTRSLIEASIDPLVTISQEGKITDVNEATLKVTGMHREELVGTDFSNYFTEPDKAREGYQGVFAKGFVTDYPLTIRHKDGHVTDVLYNASVYRNEAGEVLGVFATARDITERKLAEQKLQISEERLKFSIESGEIGLWELDLVSHAAWRTLRHDRIFGYEIPLPEWTYEMFLEHVIPEDRPEVNQKFGGAIANSTAWDFECRIKRKDGAVRWIWAKGNPKFNVRNEPVSMFGVVQDITERKQAEYMLREKEERLTLATLQNGVGVWDWNLQTQQMIWDDSMYALYHIRREDFSGTEEAWRAALHPDDLARGDQEVADAIAGKKPFETEFRVVWPNGEIHHIKAVAKVFRDDQGTPLRMLGINMDVTDLKQAEDALRKSDARLHTLVQTIPDLVWLKDKQGVYLSCNTAFERFFGAEEAAIVGKTDYDFVDRALADFFRAKDQAAIAAGGPSINEEWITFATDGHRALVQTTKIPMSTADGQLIGVLGIARDITELRRAQDAINGLNSDLERRVADRTAQLEAEIRQRATAQAALQESEARFRAITTHNPDHLLMQDNELRYTFVMNPQLGLTEQDMLGKTDYDFLSHDDAEKLMSMKRQILATGVAERIETSLMAKNGQLEYFDGAYIPRLNAEGKADGLIGYFRNITERKHNEEQIKRLTNDLQQHARNLEAANKELEAFSYSVSHDLRTPLRAIDGFSRILLDDYANKLDDDGKRLLNVVRDNAGRMGQLINDILQFSRTGRLELNKSEINMTAMVHAVVDELQPVVNRKPQFEIGPLPPAMGDRAMMHQVFVNLLSNAIKFSRAKVPAMIKVGASVAGDETIYFVQDNGAGFDMQYADKLFGVFQRLHTESEFEGTGIGLAIVKRIVTRHGGRVWAEGKVNEGATIYFALPTMRNEHG